MYKDCFCFQHLNDNDFHTEYLNTQLSGDCVSFSNFYNDMAFLVVYESSHLGHAPNITASDKCLTA